MKLIGPSEPPAFRNVVLSRPHSDCPLSHERASLGLTIAQDIGHTTNSYSVRVIPLSLVSTMAFAGIETYNSMRHISRSRPRYTTQDHFKEGPNLILLSLNAND